MRGKVVMVTGANAGIGREIVQAQAAIGATVVMVCRDRAKGEAARADIQPKTGNQNVELLIADLSSQQAIRNVVKEFDARHPSLQVLVNNAGVLLPQRKTPADGAKPTVFLASSPEVEGVSGRLFSNKGLPGNSSKLSNDESVAKRLWKVSAELRHLDGQG